MIQLFSEKSYVSVCRYRKLPSKLELLVSKDHVSPAEAEHLVRYVSLEEALEIANTGGLHLKQGHFNSKKWLSDPGKVDPRRLGDKKN